MLGDLGAAGFKEVRSFALDQILSGSKGESVTGCLNKLYGEGRKDEVRLKW